MACAGAVKRGVEVNISLNIIFLCKQWLYMAAQHNLKPSLLCSNTASVLGSNYLSTWTYGQGIGTRRNCDYKRFVAILLF